MKMHYQHQIRCIALVAVFSSSPLGAECLRVDRVEPPNWWVGMNRSRIQLMVYGNHLDRIKADFESDRLDVSAVHDLHSERYALIEFEVPKGLTPGKYRLVIRRGTDAVSIDYPILKRRRDRREHQGFGREDVIYLLTPDRFADGDPSNNRVAGILDDYDPSDPGKRHGGDLQGVIDHLDYLRDLGVTAVWLNPVLENNGINSYHGYKATDLYRVDPRLGSNELYREFVEAAHQRGLKVIFDHVNNHVGIRHPWIQDLPTPDWLNGTVDEHLSGKHYKMSISDPHADPESVRMLKTFWFVDRMPDLNQRNPFLADYRIQNTLWWIEYSGLDGIREDTYPYVDQEFLARWANAIRSEYPHFNIVGEIWNEHPAFIAQFQDGSKLPGSIETNLPAVMDFPLMEAFRRFLRAEGTLKDIYAVYAQDFLYADPDNLMAFLDNHDTPRASFIAQEDVRRIKLALTILLTARGVPQILYGTEIGMLGGEAHVDLRADFPGGFPGHRRSAFMAAGRSESENDMFDFLRTLLHMRGQRRSLTHGRMIHYPPTWNDDAYKYLKVHGQERILVVANGHEQKRRVDLSDLEEHLAETESMRDLLTGRTIAWDGQSTIVLPGLTAAVYELVD